MTPTGAIVRHNVIKCIYVIKLEYVGYLLKNGEAALKGYRLSDTLVILEGRNMFIVDMTFHDAYVRI